MKDERYGPHGEPRYTASRDAKSGMWYAHMVGYPYIPVFGSFCNTKRGALKIARAMGVTGG